MSDSPIPTATPPTTASQEQLETATARIKKLEAEAQALTTRAEQAESRDRQTRAELSKAQAAIQVKDASLRSQAATIAELKTSVTRWKVAAGVATVGHVLRSLPD